MRKSETLGLSLPYDWSNSNINDHVLIGLVLQKHRFEDVVRVCVFYGLPTVISMIADIKDVYISSILLRMIRNIENGFNHA
jgi:hypothetical protein